MKVKDLIEELKKQDPEMEVMIQQGEELKTRIEKLEMKYADICEYAGEWSMEAEKCDKEILKLNDELAFLYDR